MRAFLKRLLTLTGSPSGYSLRWRLHCERGLPPIRLGRFRYSRHHNRRRRRRGLLLPWLHLHQQRFHCPREALDMLFERRGQRIQSMHVSDEVFERLVGENVLDAKGQDGDIVIDGPLHLAANLR